MPGFKRLSTIFTDFDFSVLGCGNQLRSPDDDKYFKPGNAPVKRERCLPATPIVKNDSIRSTDTLKLFRDKLAANDAELIRHLEELEEILDKTSGSEICLLDDIIIELSRRHPRNTMLKTLLGEDKLSENDKRKRKIGET